MTPLTNASATMCQLILSLCSVSIATINNFPNIMTCFNGDYSTRPRLDITVNGQTKSWLYITGASRTCISLTECNELYLQNSQRTIKSQHCNDNLHGTSGTSLGLHGIFYLPLKIMNRTILHEVYVCKQVTDRIMGIDFNKKYHLQFDAKRWQLY